MVNINRDSGWGRPRHHGGATPHGVPPGGSGRHTHHPRGRAYVPPHGQGRQRSANPAYICGGIMLLIMIYWGSSYEVNESPRVNMRSGGGTPGLPGKGVATRKAGPGSGGRERHAKGAPGMGSAPGSRGVGGMTSRGGGVAAGAVGVAGSRGATGGAADLRKPPYPAHDRSPDPDASPDGGVDGHQQSRQSRNAAGGDSPDAGDGRSPDSAGKSPDLDPDHDPEGLGGVDNVRDRHGGVHGMDGGGDGDGRPDGGDDRFGRKRRKADSPDADADGDASPNADGNSSPDDLGMGKLGVSPDQDSDGDGDNQDGDNDGDGDAPVADEDKVPGGGDDDDDDQGEDGAPIADADRDQDGAPVADADRDFDAGHAGGDEFGVQKPAPPGLTGLKKDATVSDGGLAKLPQGKYPRRDIDDTDEPAADTGRDANADLDADVNGDEDGDKDSDDAGDDDDEEDEDEAAADDDEVEPTVVIEPKRKGADGDADADGDAGVGGDASPDADEDTDADADADVDSNTAGAAKTKTKTKKKATTVARSGNGDEDEGTDADGDGDGHDADGDADADSDADVNVSAKDSAFGEEDVDSDVDADPDEDDADTDNDSDADTDEDEDQDKDAAAGAKNNAAAVAKKTKIATNARTAKAVKKMVGNHDADVVESDDDADASPDEDDDEEDASPDADAVASPDADAGGDEADAAADADADEEEGGDESGDEKKDDDDETNGEDEESEGKKSGDGKDTADEEEEEEDEDAASDKTLVEDAVDKKRTAGKAGVDRTVVKGKTDVDADADADADVEKDEDSDAEDGDEDEDEGAVSKKAAKEDNGDDEDGDEDEDEDEEAVSKKAAKENDGDDDDGDEDEDEEAVSKKAAKEDDGDDGAEKLAKPVPPANDVAATSTLDLIEEKGAAAITAATKKKKKKKVLIDTADLKTRDDGNTVGKKTKADENANKDAGANTVVHAIGEGTRLAVADSGDEDRNGKGAAASKPKSDEDSDDVERAVAVDRKVKETKTKVGVADSAMVKTKKAKAASDANATPKAKAVFTKEKLKKEEKAKAGGVMGFLKSMVTKKEEEHDWVPVSAKTLTSDSKRDAALEIEYDNCIVGAGLSGAVIAERYATLLGKTSLIVEKRDHIGGNCFDYVDEETDIRVSKYGAHLFHTKYDDVWEYVHRFGKWTPYEHKVIGEIDGRHVPIPVNIDTVNKLFDLKIKDSDEMDKWLAKEQVKYNHEPKNSEEMALSRVGKRLYELIFKPYTKKQWDKYPKELGPEVTARIPVRNDFDGRYFGDPHQALPSDGYTSLFEKMMAKKQITVLTQTDYFDVKDKMKCKERLYFSGPIDAYYASKGLAKLEYRSLNFARTVKKDTEQFQSAAVVNHPQDDKPYTRIVEYKHLLNQKSPHTVYFAETSSDDGEPYYPVPNKKNKDLYKKYQSLAQKAKDVTFVGRLANYKYFNMDETIKNALELFDGDTKGLAKKEEKPLAKSALTGDPPSAGDKAVAKGGIRGAAEKPEKEKAGGSGMLGFLKSIVTQKKDDKKAEVDGELFSKEYDNCMVGAGISGAVIAERYASLLGQTSLIIEKRDHIGGNCYDYVDEETGIRVSKYGAHLFHTQFDRVWEYVQQFSDWTPYEHKVLGNINGKHVPIPVNIDTVNKLFDLKIKNSDEMDKWLAKEQVKYDHEPANSEEMALSRVGKRLYELIFKPYTKKQWDKYPAELGPEVTARIPVRNNFDGRYFGDPHQALPSNGYTAIFEKMMESPKITTVLNTDYFDVKDKMKCKRLYFSGPIDAYFASEGLAKLEYRSLNFERKVVKNTEQYQPASVVNHPQDDEPFTRIVEYKHLPIQPSPASKDTILFIETSNDEGDPYYPVPNKKNKDLYKKYQSMAQKEKGVTFVGRLANYKYFNMDEAILNALELFDKDTEDLTNAKLKATGNKDIAGGAKKKTAKKKKTKKKAATAGKVSAGIGKKTVAKVGVEGDKAAKVKNRRVEEENDWRGAGEDY